MTVEQFLAGFGETPAEKAHTEAAMEAMCDNESLDEILALMELECYDGPQGDA